jgi:hypothetical protein
MSIIKEVNESNQIIKAKAVNILLLPFWYVSIFLFNNSFYSKADIIINLAMCIVLSLVSSFLLSVGLSQYIQPNKNENNLYLNAISISVAFLCVWLSLLIFIVYSFEFLFNQFIYFYWFIVIYFIPIFILVLFALIKEKNTKSEKKLKE